MPGQSEEKARVQIISGPKIAQSGRSRENSASSLNNSSRGPKNKSIENSINRIASGSDSFNMKSIENSTLTPAPNATTKMSESAASLGGSPQKLPRSQSVWSAALSMRSGDNASLRRAARFTSQSGAFTAEQIQELDETFFQEPQYPAPVKWVLDKVFFPLFPDDEPFPSFIRKVAVLTLSVMASAGWMLCLYFGIMAGTQTGGWTPLRINMFGMGFYMMVWYVGINYTYIRKTQSCPPWLADVASVGAFLGMFSFTIMTLEADTRVLLMSTLLLTAMMNTPRFPLLALGHAAVYVFHYLRTNFREEIPSLRFGFDAPPSTLSEKCIVFFVLSIVPSVGAILGMYVIISRYIKRSEEARVTEKMVFEVASELQRYDLQGMEDTLKTYKKDVDKKLHVAFGGIKSNLETFRPHIPQYLIQEAIEKADLEEARIQAMLNGNGDELCPISDDEEYDEGSINLEASNVEFGSGSTSLNKSGTKFKKSGTMSDFGKMTSSVSGMSMVTAPQAAKMAGFAGITTSVFVDFNLFRPLGVTTENLSAEKSSSPGEPPLGESSASPIISMQDMRAGVYDPVGCTTLATKVMEIVNELGKATSSSVHFVSGDAVYCTWNATSRVAGHEVKAVSFCQRLRDRILTELPSSGYQPTMSIVAGRGVNMFAGTTQVHFMQFPDTPHQHEKLRSFARQFNTIVSNHFLVKSAEHQFSFVGFDFDDRGYVVHELVSKKGEAAEDEWMYQLEAQSGKNDPYATVSEAVGAFGDGDVEAAREMINSVENEIRSRNTVSHAIELVCNGGQRAK